MSYFGRRKSETSSPTASVPPSRPAQRPSSPAESPDDREKTRIASGSKVVGEVSGSAELVVEGRVEGKIDLASRVVVGSGGQVKGEITARSIQISGRVLGNVHGLERVEVLASGRLEGDMVAPQNGVHIAEGAYFTGKIEMTNRAGAKNKGGGRDKKSEAPHAPQQQGQALVGATRGPNSGPSGPHRGKRGSGK